MSTVAENIQRIRERLNEASGKYGGVTICAVSKTVPAEIVNEAYDAGLADIGENRVQELVGKLPGLNPNFRIHLIGQLQVNKVKYIIERIDMIQSLDRMPLAVEISKRAVAAGRVIPALVQVNIAKEPQKAGLYEETLVDFLREASRLPGLRIEGLMSVMPFAENPEDVRGYFRGMRAWFDRLRDEPIEGVCMNTLSMGMSGDCVVAAEEGATMVRVGSAIFGSRK